jgi:hypothetical protein
MLRAVQRLIALMKQPHAAVHDYQSRHRAWDQECRARGMTAREQADELQVRCAWVRLRTKASAAILRKPSRWHAMLDGVAADEARTLTAIGGDALAAIFLRAYAAADPFDILTADAAAAIRVRLASGLPLVQSAPSIVPDLPAEGHARTPGKGASGPKAKARARSYARG